MTEPHDLPEPITSSRVRIPASERAMRLLKDCQTAMLEAFYGNGDMESAVLDVLAHANRDAVRELLNARREGIL